MTKPRVLLICPFYPPNLGGVETHLQLLTEYLVSKKMSTTVLTYRPLTSSVDYLPLERQNHLTVHRFWWVGGNIFDKLTPYPLFQFLYIVPTLLLRSLFWSFVHPKEFDVIHAHGFAAAFITRIIGLFHPEKRKIVSTHYIYKTLNAKGLYGRLFKWVVGGFDKILLVSKESQAELESLGLPRHKMSVFHQWAPGRKLSDTKLDILKAYELSDCAILRAVFVGRIIRMKGIFEILKVAKKTPNIQYVVIGDGPDMAELTLAVNKASLSNFCLLGRKSPQEVFDILSISDLLLLPSLSPEGQPMVIMEALSAGIPAIVTNRGSAKEMIDKTVGIVIEPTVKEIVKVLNKLTKSPRQLHQMSKATKKYSEIHFGKNNAQDIINTYSHD